MFRNAPEPTKTETESAFQLSFVSQLGNVKLFLLSIAGAIVFTMLMVSANTVAMSVRERTREIGCAQDAGLPIGSVLALVLGEAVAIALMGGSGWRGDYVCSHYRPQGQHGAVLYRFHSAGLGVGVCFGMALVVGLGSSAIPALIAARTTICDALRHTG